MKNIFSRLWKLFGKKLKAQKPFAVCYIEELPEELENKTLYIAGENGYFWFASMICPCGCKEVLHMSLLEDADPHWSFIKHSDSTVSLSPSVWRKIGCKSHFFFIHSRIQWCKYLRRSSNPFYEAVL